MELGKTTKYSKFLLFLFSAFIFDTALVNSSDVNHFSWDEEISAIDFNKVFFKYTSSFENYDSYSNQFDNFFGMNYLDAENKRNFQDLSISVDSKKLRDLYEDMLEEQTTKRKFNINNEAFFKKKI